MRIVVIIASRGRPADLKLWLEHVARQSLMPNAMIWAVHSDDDLPSGEWRSRPNSPIVCKSDPGLTKQRNAALRIVPPETNIVAFFDDDYIPSSYCIEGIVNVFKLYPLAIGITGVILADGIKTVGIGVGEAMNRRLAETNLGRAATTTKTPGPGAIQAGATAWVLSPRTRARARTKTKAAGNSVGKDQGKHQCKCSRSHLFRLLDSECIMIVLLPAVYVMRSAII